MRVQFKPYMDVQFIFQVRAHNDWKIQKMKILKILFSILLLLILICILAIAALYFLMDPNQLKPIIIEKVRKQTGYQLVIDSKMSWSFYPQIGIKVEHMTLSVPNQRPFADLSNVNIATPFSTLKDWQHSLSGNIFIKEATLFKLHLHNVQVGLHWQNQVLTFRPIQAKLYEGILTGVAHGRDFSAMPKWDGSIQFNNIQLRPLLLDINGANSKVKFSGSGDVGIQIVSQGTTKEQILQSLKGKTDINFKEGVMEGIDLNYIVQTADALINKQPVNTPASNQTRFDHLTCTFAINNGIANTNNLLLTSPAFLTKGQGSINLITQLLNFQLQIKSQENIKTQWEIPVLVTGNVSSPDINIDMREIEKIIAKKELEKIKDKVKDEIKSHIPGKAGEFLQNLLGH